MAKEPSEPEHAGSTSSTTFDDLKKELRATHEREKLGIVARHRFDLDR